MRNKIIAFAIALPMLFVSGCAKNYNSENSSIVYNGKVESKVEETSSPTPSPEQTQTPIPTVTPAATPEVNQNSNNAIFEDDTYKADELASDIPQVVEFEKADVTDDKLHCFLSVSCKTILNNMSKLAPQKHSLVPSDGVIFAKKEVEFFQGESVFDVLKREMVSNKIHFEFSTTPAYNSSYIEGINNLYEFDCGDLSGWIYTVNGKTANYGSSSYILSDGDDVEVLYSCDLGRDVGQSK